MKKTTRKFNTTKTNLKLSLKDHKYPNTDLIDWHFFFSGMNHNNSDVVGLWRETKKNTDNDMQSKENDHHHRRKLNIKTKTKQNERL
ncbi:hypothetical protein DERF_013744 [Dermatophagoides farinae]|uniref:Uncharacterized protein n=1 Tax=Dermatophagoides farinae TaxID=6954 RepID=A0A922HMV1_DERFA|nr:hypothetical protein DERF_013744 [Dermatophagoides farinae]